VWGDGPSIYSFRVPAIDWYGYALDHLAWTGRESVLDAGCGRGAYLPHLARRLGPEGRLVGLDFSIFALQQACEQGTPAHLLAGDVQALPFADACFDLVLSAHMLYHVPDIRAAAAEFRRVLRLGGVLAVIIGSARDQYELDDLFLAAGGAFPLARYSDRFTADNAAVYLDGVFERIERRDARPRLEITDPDALTGYFESMRGPAEAALRPGVTWSIFSEAVRRIAAERIAREGAFHVSEEIAMLICR
jgi:SAM-dependent methyltransferase